MTQSVYKYLLERKTTQQIEEEIARRELSIRNLLRSLARQDARLACAKEELMNRKRGQRGDAS